MAHPVVHFEIGCKDKQATSEFYGNVFGWVIDQGPMGAINTGSDAGIAGHIAALGHEPHQFTHFYIETDDVAASLAKVEAAGRQLCLRCRFLRGRLHGLRMWKGTLWGCGSLRRLDEV